MIVKFLDPYSRLKQTNMKQTLTFDDFGKWLNLTFLKQIGKWLNLIYGISIHLRKMAELKPKKCLPLKLKVSNVNL